MATNVVPLQTRSEVPGLVRRFGEARFHTDGDVQALAFGADGSLWSVDEPGVLRQWNLSGQEQAYIFLSDVETLWNFETKARWLASASDDLSLWEIPSGELRLSLAQPSWVTALAFAPDARFLVSGHDNGVARIWRIPDGQLVKELDGHKGALSAVVVSPDGRQLATAGEDRVICLWNLRTGKRLAMLTGHSDRIQALAWASGSNHLASAGWDRTVRIWDAATREPVLLLNYHSPQVTALAFSPDGQLLASADSQDLVYVWDCTAGRLHRRLGGHRGAIQCLAFAPDGRSLASAGAERIVQVADLMSAQAEPAVASVMARDVMQPPPSGARLALSPGGERLAAVHENRLRVWEANSGLPLFQADNVIELQSITWSPDGALLATGDAARVIRLCPLAAGRFQGGGLADESQCGPVTALAFSSPGGLLAAAGAADSDVLIWNVEESEPILLIPQALDGCSIESLAFNLQGRLLAVAGIDWLATSGSDGAVALWDLDERAQIALFDGGSKSVAFHPSGKQLAVATLAGGIEIWDVERQQLVAELTGPEEAANSVAYSSDGGFLAAGGDDGMLCLWSAAMDKLLLAADLRAQIRQVAFSPDGAFLFTANGNGTCYQLDVHQLLAGRGAERT
jgi:WD40 repeat protein